MFRHLAAALFIVLVISIGSAQAATIYVPDDQPTIRDAVDAAGNGDVIVLRPGTYTGLQNKGVYFKGKEITITSEKGPAETIVDCENDGTGFVFYDKETAASRLDSITIANGRGLFGAGICCDGSSPTISNCVIRGCETDASGGAIRCTYDCGATITGCIVTGNSAGWQGGGIYLEWCATTTIADCVFADNHSQQNGGGVYCLQSDGIAIDGCTFSRNSGGSGGGAAIYGTAATVENSIFVNNRSTHGGGLYTKNTDAAITNCALLHNRATGSGGGLYSYKDNPTVTNCTFAGNYGGYGGGLYFYETDATVVNTILWSDWAFKGSEIHLDDWGSPSTLFISYSDIGGGQASVDVSPGSSITWGGGLIDADPLFAEPGVLDAHLTADSPCRGAGDSTAPNLPATDLEGDPMATSGLVDMGADQFHLHLYHLGDVVPGTRTDLRVVGFPGDPVMLLLGSGVLDPPWPTPFGDLYLVMPITAYCMPIIPPSGVLITSATVPASWIPGEEYPFQAFVGARLTNLMVLVAE